MTQRTRVGASRVPMAKQPGQRFFARRCPLQMPQFMPHGAMSFDFSSIMGAPFPAHTIIRRAASLQGPLVAAGPSRYKAPAMQAFTQLSGVAAPLPMINVDTDMIIPKQFLKTIKRTGLGSALFHEMRTRPDGSENPDFVLNRPAYKQAKILIAGANFGCGSSREHAPWALLDFGIRCVIAPSFADIFFNNCFKNGILPITLPQAEIDKLLDDASRGANAIVSIDLEKQEIRGPDGGMIKFEIDPFRRQCLLNGWDDIGLTLRHEGDISAFEAARSQSAPWL